MKIPLKYRLKNNNSKNNENKDINYNNKTIKESF